MPLILTNQNCLFLDIDGTLIDIAATPSGVVVPADLPETLRLLTKMLGGALAFLSGRTLADIDFLFPGRYAAGAEHGAILRNSAMRITRRATRHARFEVWRSVLADFAATREGILIEEKTLGLAVHFRNRPDAGPALHSLIQTLVGTDAEILAAHMAWEIRPHGIGKGLALDWFMQQPPFAGKCPIFIGDDVTDEPAILAARAHGGSGFHVATDFGEGSLQGPKAVRAWLMESAVRQGR
jgi:trehalose 6-phosphate phosphatase